MRILILFLYGIILWRLGCTFSAHDKLCRLKRYKCYSKAKKDTNIRNVQKEFYASLAILLSLIAVVVGLISIFHGVL